MVTRDYFFMFFFFVILLQFVGFLELSQFRNSECLKCPQNNFLFNLTKSDTLMRPNGRLQSSLETVPRNIHAKFLK